jgi:hypothetical protein
MASAFAAGFFGRLAEISAEERQAEREREARMEVIMEQRRNTVLQLAASRANSYGGTSFSSGGTSSSSSGRSQESKTAEIDAYGKYLVSQGADPDRVAQLMGTNDVEGLGKLVENVRTAKAKYSTTLQEDLPPELINDVINNAVTVDSETYTINLDDVIESFGLNPEDYNFSPEELAAAGQGSTVTRKGRIVTDVIADPSKPMSPTELEKINEMARNASVELARKELVGYKKMLEDLREGGRLYNSLEGDSDTVGYFRELATRMAMDIESALDLAKEKSYVDLMDMYGQNSYSALDDVYKLTKRGMPLPYMGDNSRILKLPEEQKDYFDFVLGEYGITNYTFVPSNQ